MLTFRHRRSIPLSLALLVAVGLAPLSGCSSTLSGARADPAALSRSARLPSSLSNAEFWNLVSGFSEPGGYFQSDNFTSNEMGFPAIAAALIETGVSGGAYIGVGPEQNFHYIAAIRPEIVFQLDIRRQAVIQHLMYKAIFELSDDRAAFLSLLMSRPRPAGLNVNTTIAEILAAFQPVPADPQLYSGNLSRIQRHLLNTRRVQLDSTDLVSLTYVYEAFYRLGPNIAYSGRSSRTNFGTLAGAVDALGTPRSFLGSDENFRFIKDMHGKNLIIPVVGDFAGPSAIRSIADYLARRNTKVSAFYVSNVETYLFRNGVWGAFYSNVATLPVDSTSVFIRPSGSGLAPVIIVDGRRVAGQIFSAAATQMSPNVLCPIQGFIRAFLESRITTVRHATQCNR